MSGQLPDAMQARDRYFRKQQEPVSFAKDLRPYIGRKYLIFMVLTEGIEPPTY